MKRKLIKLAEKTLVLSLPTIYVQEQGLEKGDEVDVTIKDHELVITPGQTTQILRTCELSVKGFSDRVLRWLVSSLHKQGFDEIIVLDYTSQQAAIIDELTKDLFIGFIVKEKTQLRIVVGQVAAVAIEEFDATLRRAFFLLKEQSEKLVEAFFSQDEALLAKQLLYEKDNNKLTNFCERLLNKHLTQKEQGHFYYVIAWNMEKIADSFKYIAQQKLSSLQEPTLQLLKAVHNYVCAYVDVIYKYDVQVLVTLSRTKEDLLSTVHALLQSGTDVLVVHYLGQVILQVADFSASLIALHTTGDVR